MNGIIIGRHINGITINGLEYVLDDNGEYMVFETEEKAKEFLFKHGFKEENIENLVFEEYSDDKDE